MNRETSGPPFSPAGLPTKGVSSIIAGTLGGPSARPDETDHTVARGSDPIRKEVSVALVGMKDVHLTFGDPPLFSGVSFHLEEGDRLCLLGRNGCGKTTFLKLVAGETAPDSGQIAVSRDTTVRYVGQSTPPDRPGSALDYCSAAGCDSVEASKHLSRLGVDPDAVFATLSGGARRRVALASGLAAGADVLLLDEPTNHLDVDAILQLEAHLVGRVRTLILVTHDRAFAAAVANRTAEIDRGRLRTYDVGFAEFFVKRDAELAMEERQNEKFDKLMLQEEAWLARGVKARRTRDEGRVGSLMRMRDEYAARRTAKGGVRITVDGAGRSAGTVFATHDLSFSYPDAPNPVIRGLSVEIARGDKVGIVGPNGCGKTTLVRLLTGDLEPTGGSVKQGAGLEPLYFDQMRNALEPTKSVVENISGGDDAVVVGGRSRHINSYLADFLFEPDRARMPVGALSGGEQARVMLAKLFTRPSNLLILDEPTNDLDLETLDLLEQMLVDYAGTVLLVTHDRAFLDNVVASSLVFPGDGTVLEFAGGYSDWRDRVTFGEGGQGSGSRPKGGTDGRPKPDGASSTPDTGGPRRAPVNRVRKLSYKESRELDELPGVIDRLERRIEELHAKLTDPALYASGDGDRVKEATALLESSQAELDAAFERWQELEEIGD